MNDFDARAKDWDSDPTKIERARAIAAAIEANVPLEPSMHALEYGAGTGLLGFALRPRVGELTLVDGSVGMLDVVDDQVHDFQAFGAMSRISVGAIARIGEAVQVFAPVPKMAARA